MTTVSLVESYAYCRKLTKRTAHNFRFSFLTLPRDRYDAMCALYAFMRITDDLADDEAVPLAQREEQLLEWRVAVTEALNGALPSHPKIPSHPALPALADIVARHRIPTAYLFDVITGVSRDLHPRPIATFEELADYCYHVAGAVGLCCIHIWGYRDPEAVPLAIDCGLALQLTNILRDVAEDSRAGRCYLPTEDLQRFGYSSDDLAAGVQDRRFRDLMRFEVDRAREYYRRAQGLFPLLEPGGRPILRVMLDLYGGLLNELERRDFAVFHERVRLPRWKKLWLVGRALCWPVPRSMPRE
jgi:phytoene synthase